MFVTVLLTAAQYNVVDYLPITIRILRQKNNWVGGSRKWPILLKFSTLFMLT